MTAESSRNARTLAVAEEVARTLRDLGVHSALIGAGALAVHGYPRATTDLDLAAAADPFSTLREARDRLRAELGMDVKLVTPDADDPLGGVLTVSGPDFDPIQVVNFFNPLAGGVNPGEGAIREALPGLIEDSELRVVDLPHLIALKLYSGGYKSRLDILELLRRNPDASLDRVHQVSAAYGLLEAWEELLRERGG